MPEGIVERSCRYNRKIRGRARYARDRAVQFAFSHGLIRLNGRNEVVWCFGVYFDSWNKPETFTGCSSSFYIYNIEG